LPTQIAWRRSTTYNTTQWSRSKPHFGTWLPLAVIQAPTAADSCRTCS
jgi:hypothetical protein